MTYSRYVVEQLIYSFLCLSGIAEINDEHKMTVEHSSKDKILFIWEALKHDHMCLLFVSQMQQ